MTCFSVTYVGPEVRLMKLNKVLQVLKLRRKNKSDLNQKVRRVIKEAVRKDA